MFYLHFNYAHHSRAAYQSRATHQSRAADAVGFAAATAPRAAWTGLLKMMRVGRIRQLHDTWTSRSVAVTRFD
jgi:hypothetical protein